MKRIVGMMCGLCILSLRLLAQDEGTDEKGFKKENLFTGGSITVSFFNGQTILGANPIFGYRLAKWVDAGLAINYVYSGARDYNEFDDKIRQTTWGPGFFTRIYPISILFAQAQFEHNFNTLKYTAAPNSVNYMDGQINTEANTLLVGGGVAQGRSPKSNSFYYMCILFDVLKNVNSPYVNVAYDPNNPGRQRVTMTPIIRAGFNIALFQGRYK
jgi:hypothetical protein